MQNFSTNCRRLHGCPASFFLAAALVHFLTFGCWPLIAVIGHHIHQSMTLSGPEFSVLMAMPLISSIVLAAPAGRIARRYGPSLVVLASLAALVLVLSASLFAKDLTSYYAVSSGLGLAGLACRASQEPLDCPTSEDLMPRASVLLAISLTSIAFNLYLSALIYRAYSWHSVLWTYLILLLLGMAIFLLLTEQEA